MPMQITCPRCQRQLSVAPRKAGSYGNCPRCRARLWIPAAESDDRAGGALMAVRSEATPQLATRSGNGRPAKAPRVVSSPAAPTTLLAADDGKLPQLQLHESAASSPVISAAGVHPLVLISLLCLSGVASMAVLLLPKGSNEAGRSEKLRRARAALQADYFSEMDGKPRFAYQYHLRAAERAHQRGDYAEQRRRYREVLALLRAERLPITGVSGSPGRDRELEKWLKILLSD